MFCTISETEGGVVHLKLVSAPPPPPPHSAVLVISRFGFKGWVLIASVPDLCIIFTFNADYDIASSEMFNTQ